VWFIGFTPELVAGVYLGYDKPKSLGASATGGGLAVPVFTEFMQNALKGKPPTPFNMPSGMTQVWIDPHTGVKANAGETAIAEAFKPGTGPNLVTSVIGVDSGAFQNLQNGGDGTDGGFGFPNDSGIDNSNPIPPAPVENGNNGRKRNNDPFSGLFGQGGLF
jgi:penicillin-binding protein 1A